MLVKCRICGTKKDKKEAFSINKGKQNFYYCSEEEYLNFQEKKSKKKETTKKVKTTKEKTSKDFMYEEIYEIFGEKVINTALYKEMFAISEVYGYDKMYSYIKENKSMLSSCLEKDFNSEYAKIRYFSAIIKNSIKDFTEIKDEPIISVDIEIVKNAYVPKKTRKSLEEYEAEVSD